MLVSLFLLLPHQDLTMDTDLTAANGKKVKALEIFAYALQYFKEQALKVGHVPGPYGRGRCTCQRGEQVQPQKAARNLMHCWWEWKMGQLPVSSSKVETQSCQRFHSLVCT